MDAVVKNSQMYGAVVSDNPLLLRALAHPIREKILEMTYKQPMYPVEIARKLKMIEQKIYYHIKILKKSGAVKEVEERQLRGGKAKLITPTATAFGYIMKQAKGGEVIEYSDYPPFVVGGVVETKIIVGSPDPHGPNRARARDGHLASEISSFFGRMGTVPWPFVFTDIELKDKTGNLVILGGPVVNTLAAEYNQFFPVKFVERAIISPNKEYVEDWCGFVAMADNPRAPGKKVMMIAGRTGSGTRAAILGLRKYFEEVQKKGYIVVQGFDEDGDGIVDSIDLLE
ncbi:MAG: helix-turn-helix domain-containing protein [Candidatus Altiarchaeota archaeon]|nr:helix-turn-helix domain-containing protein [Candidatus Altiarchaeota archaeon]